MTDNLFDEPKLDEFKTESPLRAFASYDMMGLYMIAKGFRPSLGHLTRYLDAMEKKEGWQFVQLLEASTGVPTIIFRNIGKPLDLTDMDPATRQKVEDALRNPVHPPLRVMPGPLRSTYDPTKHIAVLTLRGLDTERTHWSAASWNGNPEDLMDRLKLMSYSGTRQRFLEQESAEDMRHYWRTASVASVLRLIDMLGVWDELSLADPISYDELAKAIGHEPNTLCLHHHSAKREEVTSASPVDALEAAAEELADDLNLDVDRESFAMARAHVAETVERPEDVPNDMREKAFAFVIERLGVEPKYREANLRDYKKRFLNPKGTPMPPHTLFVGQVKFMYGDRFHVNAIREAIEAWKNIQALYEPQPKGDDPLNPQHYNGRECADIGERLSANGYQILKYCWRLGKKDDPCQELGKALWYLDSEISLMGATYPHQHIPPNFVGIDARDRLSFLLDRTANQSQFTAEVARFLWHGYKVKDLDKLKAIIADHKARLDCGSGMAL